MPVDREPVGCVMVVAVGERAFLATARGQEYPWLEFRNRHIPKVYRSVDCFAPPALPCASPALPCASGGLQGSEHCCTAPRARLRRVAPPFSAFLRLSPPFPRLHAGLIEPPPGSRGTSTRIDQTDFFQHLQVVAERPRGWRLGELGEDLSKTPPLPVTQHLEDLSLPIRQIVSHPQRRVVSGREESDDDRTGLLLELGLRLTSGHAPGDDFLCASTPLLDQPSTVEDPGDQRVAEAGGVVPLEVGPYAQLKGNWSSMKNGKPLFHHVLQWGSCWKKELPDGDCRQGRRDYTKCPGTRSRGTWAGDRCYPTASKVHRRQLVADARPDSAQKTGCQGHRFPIHRCTVGPRRHFDGRRESLHASTRGVPPCGAGAHRAPGVGRVASNRRPAEQVHEHSHRRQQYHRTARRTGRPVPRLWRHLARGAGRDEDPPAVGLPHRLDPPTANHPRARQRRYQPDRPGGRP